MTFTADTPLPNLRQIVGESRDVDRSRLIAAARANTALADALESIEGYTTTTARLDALVQVGDDWTKKAQAAAVAADSQGALIAALDTGDTDGLPDELARAATEAERLRSALGVAAQTARSLSAERINLVTSGAETMLAHLDERLAEQVQRYTDARAKLKGADSAQAAIDAGTSRAWAAFTDAREQVGAIRAAQTSIMRNLDRSLFDELAPDNRKMLACAEVEDWSVIEPELPQIIRHDGRWSNDGPKGASLVRGNARPGNRLVDPMRVPWPDDKDGRTTWLLEHHPEAMRVLSLEQAAANLSELHRQCSRRTPSGQDQEPQRASGEQLVPTRTVTA